MACSNQYTFVLIHVHLYVPSLSFILCLPLLVQVPMPRRQRSGVNSGCIFDKQRPKPDWPGDVKRAKKVVKAIGVLGCC